MFEPWMLAAMEEAGYMDTHEGLIDRITLFIACEGINLDGKDAFKQVCLECDVDPSILTEDDFVHLRAAWANALNQSQEHLSCL